MNDLKSLEDEEYAVGVYRDGLSFTDDLHLGRRQDDEKGERLGLETVVSLKDKKKSKNNIGLDRCQKSVTERS